MAAILPLCAQSQLFSPPLSKKLKISPNLSAETLAAEETKSALIKKVDASWNLKTSVITPDETPARETTLREDLAEVQINEVNAMRSPLSQALQSIIEQTPEDLAPNLMLSGNDPEVSVNLKNTNALEAIELVVESVGYICEWRGNTLVVLPANIVGPLKTRYFPISQSLITRLVGAEVVKSVPNTPPSTNNKTIESSPAAVYQHGATEGALKSFFERIGISWPEGSGMVLADGELIVTHNTRTLDKIETIINRLARHRQVEIEARFMEVGEGSLNELGVQWSFSNKSGNKTAGTFGSPSTSTNSLRSLSQAFSTSSTVSGAATAPDVPGGVNLATNASNNIDITGFIDSSKIRGVLSALSQQNGTELLSAPRLTVLSGSTASITVAQELRYPQSYDRVNTDVGSSSSSGSAGSILTAPTPLDFTTRNVGVQMQVTPYVEDDGSVTLILQPEVTQFVRFIDYGGQSVVVNGSVTSTVPSGFFQPVFEVRRLSTEVNLPSGATVLLGGLTRQETVKVKDKVPLLGDIPLLGRAFRSSGSSTLKKNLIVFVTARLVE
jgi:general secretion pathway protein D